MEKERKGLFERLMDFWKEKIYMAGEDRIGFWYEKNPLEDLRNLKNVSMVISRGNMYTSPTLHRFEKVEALLNL